MDLNELKNLNMEDLKAKVLAFADKKTLIKIGISLGSIIVFLIIYYAILNPIVKDKKTKIDDMKTKQAEITKFNNDIANIKKKIKKLKPQYDNYSTLFHSRAEVEGLYQNLSEFAAINGLVISKIEKGKPKVVTKSEVLNPKKKKKASKKKKKASKKEEIKKIAYYKIPVSFEIRGNFIGYIKFKRALSLSNKMLNFDKESVKVVKSTDSTGAINVSGVLTIVGLADEFY
jgi:Tfp pilus assembly protein PilO|tara:strand:+ start:2320 stop:3009 length:690 start_codon:yes stop_codon:yes gene_type:complete